MVWSSAEDIAEDITHSIRNGNLGYIKYLIEDMEIDVDYFIEGKISTVPIEFAASCGKLDIVKYLLENGADIGSTINSAAKQGHLDIVKYLVEEEEEYAHGGALICAARGGHLDIVKYLVEEEANVNYKDSYQRDTPIIAASSGGNLDVVKYLVEKGADINVVDSTGRSPLSASKKYLEIIKYLLEQGADANKVLETKDLNIISYFVEYGVTFDTEKLKKLIVDIAKFHQSCISARRMSDYKLREYLIEQLP